jgi:hypothetical protein
MIDTITDTLVPLSRVARTLPHPPSPATLWRWHTRGIGGERLEIVRVGGRVYTTREAFADFVSRTTAAAQCHDVDTQEAVERSPATERRLREAGLL